MSTHGAVSASTLCASDLQLHPVWQFCADAEGDDGVDESHVAPSGVPVALGSPASYLVAATYGLQNGASLPGSVQVDVLGKKAYFTPAVVYAQGKPVDPLARDAQQRLSRILKAANTRPVRWELTVAFQGEKHVRRGRIARSWLGTALALLVRLVFLRFRRRGR